MSKYIALFLILAFATTAFTAPRRTTGRNENSNLKWWTESKAITYTSKSFEANVGKENFMIIQFCATFSKDCEALAPEYSKLAEMYSGATAKRSDVIVSKIDGWTFNSLSQTYSVKKFPTIRFFNKGDPTNSDEYEGVLTADLLSEWMEGLIKAKAGGAAAGGAAAAAPATEEKKPEEAKKEAVPEPPKKEEKQPEAASTNEAQNTATKQETAKPVEAVKSGDGEDLKKEFKLVLNTTLLQGQFDEVQKQLNILRESLEKSITENFKKVEALSQNFEHQRNDLKTVQDVLARQGDKVTQLSGTMASHKDEIKNHFSTNSENHFSGLKDSVSMIREKVHEKKEEVPTGPGLMHNLIYMVIGGAIGGIAVFFLASGGGKKRRSMLD